MGKSCAKELALILCNFLDQFPQRACEMPFWEKTFLSLLKKIDYQYDMFWQENGSNK
jgi:hypothetical protein